VIPHETIIRNAIKAGPYPAVRSAALASLDALAGERAALGLFLWKVADLLGVQPVGGWPDDSTAGIVEEHITEAVIELKAKAFPPIEEPITERT
jgi:hypothetical protein